MPSDPTNQMNHPASVDELATGLRAVGYLPGDSTSLVSYLATKLGKPVLVEGPAGVGKTELAKALSRYLGRTLIRLQCYEGLDEAKALYEWNYRKQLLRIQTESDDASWRDVQDDIFGEEFLLPRPLMTAIASAEPVVLLIDEIDKTDQEFEAMLLELLSRLPDLDPRARADRGDHPAGGAAHLEQHPRADRGAQAPLPVPVARLPERRSRARDRPPAHARTRSARSPASWSRSSTRSATWT